MSCSAIRARNSICPPDATRNKAPLPGDTTCPGSTLRSSTTPASGARMERRLIRSCISRTWACTTATRARAESRVAVRRSMSALEIKPRSTSPSARSSSDCASRASAPACTAEAFNCANCARCTDESTSASTCPRPTVCPASARIATIIPPSPTTPTGMSRRAAMLPMAAIRLVTLLVPGTSTVTAGGPAGGGVGLAAVARATRNHTNRPTASSTAARISPAFMRCFRTAACASSPDAPASAAPRSSCARTSGS